ncbi:MAG: 3-hydroxyisobutyrate dehydrogenase [Solirubrobacterales bacterium]|jgi:3-hydroxyisobutyrate dehydrogenase|nr:3-hydroxyisobutyrate dehydrogenase [Solirubrobacterales bacterium]
MSNRGDRPVLALLGAGGTMGKGMAHNLARAGIEVRAWNRTYEKLDDLADEDGLSRFREADEAVDGAAVVLTMLSDAEAVLGAMEEAAGAAPSGAIWLQMSTIGIEGTERCSGLASARGLVFVDAPVLGTKQPAEEGTLVVLASGPESAREPLKPALEAIGKRTMWVGEPGAGSRLKVAVNSWIVSVVEGLAETLVLAEGVGVDPETFLDAIADGPLDLPYLRLKSKAMLERDFTPSFRLSLAAKDADLVVRAARAGDLELPMLEAISKRMAEGARERGDEDLAATYLTSAPAG